jgi:hypothetical protein
MRNKLITGLLLAVLVSTVAQAEWSYVTENIYLDYSTIKKTKNGYRAWRLSDYTKVNELGASAKILYEYNCIEERSRILQMHTYSGHMGKGRIVVTDDLIEKWEYVIPGSVGEFILKMVCNRAK